MLLLELSKETNTVLSAAWTDGDFIDLPSTSYSLHVTDQALATDIWESHTNGGTVTRQTDGTFSVETITPVEPEPVKTPEQLRIEQLERDNEQLMHDNEQTMLAMADIYEQIIALQGGS